MVRYVPAVVSGRSRVLELSLSLARVSAGPFERKVHSFCLRYREGFGPKLCAVYVNFGQRNSAR